MDNNLIMSLGQLFGYRRTFGLGIQWRNRTVGNKMFMQWWGDVKAISFYLRSTFGHVGQIRFQKPTTAQTQTLAASFANIVTFILTQLNS